MRGTNPRLSLRRLSMLRIALVKFRQPGEKCQRCGCTFRQGHLDLFCDPCFGFLTGTTDKTTA